MSGSAEPLFPLRAPTSVEPGPAAEGIPLVCVPTAGHGALQFDRWPDTVGPWRIHPVRYPDRPPADGAAVRFGYPGRAAALISALGDVLAPGFGLFGHQGAALVAYEMAVALHRAGRPAPGWLFASGSPAPQRVRQVPVPSDGAGAEDELAERALAAILATQGIPLPALVTAEVRALRADALARNAYRPVEPVRLPTPVTVLNWTDQGLAAEELAGWSACGAAELVSLPGGELDYTTVPAELLRVLAARPGEVARITG